MCNFDICGVQRKFTACLKDNDVLLQEYCDAYSEVSKLLSFFGKIFYFVTRDVDHKLNILYEHCNQDPVHYRSVKNMTEYEATVDANQVSCKGKANGCRTILRLHRALVFVIELVAGICTAPEDVTLCRLVKEGYDIHLSPFHPWVVRKAVGLGLHALPTREQLVDHIVESQPKGSKLVGREACRVAMLELAIPAMRSVYECTHHWLALHDMLNLP
ncbi:hypothetical protein EG68_11256 [Paragonimus skrjabini miyazakii]|uniref:Glycolipid transfer protein domain-containing protein n=1 Tax=Paragonimus skrjabini miyazakii TaxID=59628 RepID=A0A8S9YHS7_9TREM|nr:hypothetical protein EG68_11256 [Paragonimus skrjabini miyazakii]